MKLNEHVINSFWCKVNKLDDDSCWLWLGTITKLGYGLHYIGVISGRYMYEKAHRVSYQLHNGELNRKLVVCHKCNNKACVNPWHLYQATAKQNSTDAAKDGLYLNYSGEKHFAFITTDEFRLKVYSLHKKGLVHEKIAKELNVSQAHIGNILKGKDKFNCRNNSFLAHRRLKNLIELYSKTNISN